MLLGAMHPMSTLEGETPAGANDEPFQKDLPLEEQRFTLGELSELTGIGEEYLVSLVTTGQVEVARQEEAKRNLTVRQRQVLDIITDEFERVGKTPTIRTIAAALGVSSHGTINQFLGVLQRKEYIARESPYSRKIIILRSSSDLNQG